MYMKEINDELTYKIIGCAMKVHNILGNACLAGRQGFQEVIYQRCLALELEKQKITFLREKPMPIYYEGRAVGKRRADFIENTVLIELKAVIKLEDVLLAQGLNYLEECRIEKGQLINFGSPSLEVKRLFRKEKQARNNLTRSNPDNP